MGYSHVAFVGAMNCMKCWDKEVPSNTTKIMKYFCLKTSKDKTLGKQDNIETDHKK
jgi:hypothetical protein